MSTIVTARVRTEDAELFRKQAARHGITTSKAIEALVRTAIAVERAGEQTNSRGEDTPIPHAPRG